MACHCPGCTCRIVGPSMGRDRQEPLTLHRSGAGACVDVRQQAGRPQREGGGGKLIEKYLSNETAPI